MKFIPRMRWITLALCLLLAVFLVLVWAAFSLRMLTPFAANIDTTAVMFTTGTDEAAGIDPQQFGLLAGPSIVNLRVAGCTSLELVASGPSKVQPCDEEALEIRRAQLSRVELSPGTRVSLWLTPDVLHVKFYLPQDADRIGVFLSANPSEPAKKSKNGTVFGENDKPQPGLWRVKPSSRILTLELRDDDSAPLQVGEDEMQLTEGSSLLFQNEKGKGSLVGSSNILVLPELPEELGTIHLARGIVAMMGLRSGTIHHLGITRSDQHLKAIHVELTGSSKALFVHNLYTADSQNEALTFFDANSGKDPKLRMIAVAVLVLGTITAVSSLIGLVLHFIDLWLNLERWRALHGNQQARATLKAWFEPEVSDFEEIEEGVMDEAERRWLDKSLEGEDETRA